MVLSTTLSAKTLFSMHGSNTVGSKLGPQLAKSYHKELHHARNIRILKTDIAENKIVRGFHPATNEPLDIKIQAHGSSTGFKALDSGAAEICMSSRQIKATEAKKLISLGDLYDFKSENIIALDGIAIIVHKSNPLKTLTKSTLTDIFSGKISTWGELSDIYKKSALKSRKINIYARDNNSGTYDTFNKLVLTKTKKLAHNARRYESNAVLSDDVASDPAAIGFVSLPNIRNAKAISVSVGMGSARKPEALTVATEEYALSRRLYMYISEYQQNQYAKDFLKHVNSISGQKVVTHSGYVSQNIYPTTIKIHDYYPTEYKQLTRGAKRLSVNIYFKQGTLTPDNRAKRDLLRVSNFIKSLRIKPKHIMLFGFSEDTDFKMFNISLSESRADFIELLLKKQGITIDRIRGFGSVNPVAIKSEKAKNRRVEIWIK